MTTLNITPLTDRPPTSKILVYGESGVGKTVFASTAPRPILFLDSEGGTASIGDRSEIDTVRMNGLEDFRQALQYLEGNPDLYKTIVIDSLTDTQTSVMKDIMREAKRMDPTRDEFMPQFGEWGRLTGIMREIIRAYRNLDANVIYTALVREDTDEMTGRTKVRPALTPRLAGEVLGYMDAVVYMYTVTQKAGEVATEGAERSETEEGPTIVRNALLTPTGKYSAKLRTPKGTEAPDYLTSPSWDEVNGLLFPTKGGE